jgi:predicted MPP superfamily phosphohydrolase
VGSRRRTFAALAAGGAVAAAWGLFESQWVECRELDVGVAGLRPELDGLTILHLTDFHAGTPSFNLRALRKAVDFGVRTHPDLVAVTGDIVSHSRASAGVVAELARLAPPLGMFAVLGNHDVGASNDPFSRGVVIEDWGPAAVTLLRGETAAVDVHGARIHIGGLDADSWLRGTAAPAGDLFHGSEGLRLLLAHFPEAAEELPPGAADLVLCGHLHGGQICVPTPWGKLRLAHGVHHFHEGVYEHGPTTVIVSRGLGTTLVPFRLAARPEVSLLRLRRRE